MCGLYECTWKKKKTRHNKLCLAHDSCINNCNSLLWDHRQDECVCRVLFFFTIFLKLTSFLILERKSIYEWPFAKSAKNIATDLFWCKQLYCWQIFIIFLTCCRLFFFLFIFTENPQQGLFILEIAEYRYFKKSRGMSRKYSFCVYFKNYSWEHILLWLKNLFF